VGDDDGDCGAVVGVYRDLGHACEDLLAGDNVAEDGVFAVEVRGVGEGYEESVERA
jgi:hypothetical protein